MLVSFVHVEVTTPEGGVARDLDQIETHGGQYGILGYAGTSKGVKE